MTGADCFTCAIKPHRECALSAAEMLPSLITKTLEMKDSNQESL